MDRFIIHGGHRLQGTITPSGNKNAALPIIASCLLTDEYVHLKNVPRIGDVQTMLQLLDTLGVEIDDSSRDEITLRARNVRARPLDPALCRQIRASLLLAGPMLARLGQVNLPMPGGDLIGRRRVDTHLLALESLGADVHFDGGFSMQADGLRGADILMDEASVTATENTLAAATMAEGTTIIRNAACEPHVQDLAKCLTLMGANIQGAGTNTITIEGGHRLRGCEYTIQPDYHEVGSFLGLGALTPGEIRIAGVLPEQLRMILMVFCQRLGVRAHLEGRMLVVEDEQCLKIRPDAGNVVPKIDSMPWPGFSPDLLSIALVVATQAQGTVLIHEKMFESRLYFVDKLISMGAQCILCDPHRCVVVGPARLHGQELTSPDIRAGMALLIAALAAEGTSVIGNISQIDRGYEKIEAKLRTLGAQIERV